MTWTLLKPPSQPPSHSLDGHSLFLHLCISTSLSSIVCFFSLNFWISLCCFSQYAWSFFHHSSSHRKKGFFCLFLQAINLLQHVALLNGSSISSKFSTSRGLFLELAIAKTAHRAYQTKYSAQTPHKNSATRTPSSAHRQIKTALCNTGHILQRTNKSKLQHRTPSAHKLYSFFSAQTNQNCNTGHLLQRTNKSKLQHRTPSAHRQIKTALCNTGHLLQRTNKSKLQHRTHLLQRTGKSKLYSATQDTFFEITNLVLEKTTDRQQVPR